MSTSSPEDNSSATLTEGFVTTQTLKIARFNSITQPEGFQSVLTLPEVARLLSDRQQRAAKDGPLFSFAHYHDSDVYRSDARVTAVSGLVVDVDNSVGRGRDAEASSRPTLPQDYAERLDRMAYGWYSTHNHSPAWPRWRLWVPLSRPLTPSEFKAAHGGLLALLGRDGNIDPSCGELSRCYYLPSCPPEQAGVAFSGFVTGRLLNPDTLLVALSPAAEARAIGAARVSHVRLEQHAGRNDTLKAIATAMIYRGEANDSITSELLKEDAKFFPPLFTDITEGYSADAYTGASTFVARVRRSINQHRAAHGEALLLPRNAAPALASTVGDRSLKVVPIGDLSDVAISPTTYAIEPLIPIGQVTLLGAHGGSGKSMLALIIAAHFASSRSWADLPVNGGRVAFVSLEDSGSLVIYRLQLIVAEYGLDKKEVSENLIVLDGTDSDGTLAIEVAEFGVHRLTPTSCMEEMKALTADARLIVVDNASDAFDGNENDRRLVRAFVRMLARIARTNDAGVLLLSHVDKASAKFGSQRNSYSGSTAWHNSSRSRLALIEVDGRLELRQEKLNLGKPSESIVLRWTSHGVLKPTNRHDADDCFVDSADEFALLQAFSAADAAGINVPVGRSGPSTTQNVLADFPELPRFLCGSSGRHRFLAALERLRRAGRVRLEQYRNDGRQLRKRYVAVDAASRALIPPIPAN